MFLPPSVSARPVVRPGTAVGESEKWADQRQVMGAIKNGWDDFFVSFVPTHIHTSTRTHAHIRRSKSRTLERARHQGDGRTRDRVTYIHTWIYI